MSKSSPYRSARSPGTHAVWASPFVEPDTLNESWYKRAFYQQRNNAKIRGIGWDLTYQQWRDWWGADIDRRGTGRSDLQMQRIADAGPYALDNIRKGVPKDNARTRGAATQNRIAARVESEYRAQLGEIEPEDPQSEDEQELAKLGYANASSRWAWA